MAGGDSQQVTKSQTSIQQFAWKPDGTCHRLRGRRRSSEENRSRQIRRRLRSGRRQLPRQGQGSADTSVDHSRHRRRRETPHLRRVDVARRLPARAARLADRLHAGWQASSSTCVLKTPTPAIAATLLRRCSILPPANPSRSRPTPVFHAARSLARWIARRLHLSPRWHRSQLPGHLRRRRPQGRRRQHHPRHRSQFLPCSLDARQQIHPDRRE